MIIKVDMIKLIPEIEVTFQNNMGYIHNKYLVYAPFFGNDDEIKIVNTLYIRSKNDILKAFTHKEYIKYIWLTPRPYRLDALLNIPKDKLTQKLIYDVWIDSEAPELNLDIWKNLMFNFSNRYEDNSNHSLTGKYKLKIYSGYGDDEPFKDINFISWTLSKSVALWFANRFKQQYKYLITTEVNIDIVKAYLTNRNEDEIIIDNNDILTYNIEKL